MVAPHLDRDDIVQLLTHLGERLHNEGISGELYLVDGAAMALAYDGRRFTRDVDAVFEPKMRIYDIAAEIAAERGLPVDWLNDGVKGFVVDDPHAGPVYEFEGLRVQVASPQLLLALKVRAARLGEDDDDLRRLAAMLDLSTSGEVLDLAVEIVGERHMTPRSRFFVEQVVGSPPDADVGP